MSKIKIGQISYTNTLPVDYFFDRQQFQDKVEWIPQVPAQLNKRMESGKIHLGPISSFAYAANHSQYSVLSDLSISALGPVRSIFLFSKKPIDQLIEGKIALTNTSATSVNLLKIIMEKFLGGHPEYFSVNPDLNKMLEQADAALLIGDDALLARRQGLHYDIYDLGEVWYKETGMWMTFAVWAVRNELISQYPDLLARIHDAFLTSKYLGINRISDVIKKARSSFGGDVSFWKKYYSGLSYDLTTDHIKGLEYYYQCAAELNLLPNPVKVRTWESSSHQSHNEGLTHGVKM